MGEMADELDDGDDGDDLAMGVAIDEARRALAHGDVPIGAVVLRGGEVIAARHNERQLTGDPTAHAEVLALRAAAAKAGNYRLTGAVLYATVEPCAMCCGALVNARIARVVYGAPDPKAGAVESLYRLLDEARLNHRVDAVGGVLADESVALLRGFFDRRRR